MTIENMTVSHNAGNISATAYLPEKEQYPFVIFSHGFNGSGNDFKNQATVLAENGIGAFTFDFRGGSIYSKSDMKTTEMTVFTEKEDLFAVLDFVKSLSSADPNNIFLFGASMGGLVSALTADERPDDIKGIILLYPAFCIADDWNRIFTDINDIPEIHKVWDVPLGKCFFESLHDFSVFEHIGKYPKNVLIMHGDKDSVVSVEYGRKADRLYPNSVFELFSGEGHGFSPEADRRVTQMLLEFVNNTI